MGRVLTLLAGLALSAGAQAACYDCECDSRGLWAAWDPDAVGHWSGGRTEPRINVRRCGELNRGATGGVCTPGSFKNIYEDRAPAIVSPRCRVFGGDTDDTNDSDPGDDGVDRYARLLELYEAPDATVPTIADLSHYWSGRCFDEGRRWQAKGGLLFASAARRNDGPLFPTQGDAKVYLLEHTSDPSAFDSLSADELSTVRDLVSSLGPKVSKAQVLDNALTSDYVPESGTPVRWRVRQVTRDGRLYYVAQAALAEASDDRPQGFVIKTCYHYARSVEEAP